MKQTKVIVNDVEADITDDAIPVALSFEFEDNEDFQKKKGSDSFSITLPATKLNSRNANSMHLPSIVDMTSDKAFKNAGTGCIEVNSVELLRGKSFLKSGKHTNMPVSYSYDFYGDNKDWAIELKDTTLYELLSHINFDFTKSNIVLSWLFDGTNEALPYVFAPVRYRNTMGDNDDDMSPDYMRPSISKYWLIYWAFKSIGYRINSTFLDSQYFRRQVMPWTWGSFLYSDGTRLDTLDFLAKSTAQFSFFGNYSGLVDLDVSNDSTDGGFDNSNSYSYNSSTKTMKWTYLSSLSYGRLNAFFSMAVDIDATAVYSADSEMVVKWYKKSIATGVTTLMKTESLYRIVQTGIGRKDFRQLVDLFFDVSVDPGDEITATLTLGQSESATALGGRVNCFAKVISFEFEYFTIPLGGRIDFQNYTAFKKYKFLDLLRGVTDEFNLIFKTDPVSKVVTIEPCHDYSITATLNNKSNGYIKNDIEDWTPLQDLSKESEMSLYSEGDREYNFKYKDDSGDGGLKILENRFSFYPGTSKYLLPTRFQAGKKDIENRFFSKSVHYDVFAWKNFTGIAPQMMVIMPENVSNASNKESESTILPKSAYYKGFDYTCGWKFDGEQLNYFPFMFAVNYKPGGEADPILSYSDERISTLSGGSTIGYGLMKRFYWQRLAIIRNGQQYKSFFRLPWDAILANHRNYKVIDGIRYERPAIKNLRPAGNDSTEVSLWKWEPVTAEDNAASFPSRDMVLTGSNAANSDDIKYAPLKIQSSDLTQ